MLCEICGKNPATFHYTEIINGEKSEHHICAECAANTDMSYYTMFDQDNPFVKLLNGILGAAAGLVGDEESDGEDRIACPNCKMTYGEFLKKSSFGCPTCYDVFGPLIPDTIKKLQGSDHHVGKHPASFAGSAELSDGKEPITPVPAATKTKTNTVQDEIESLSAKLKEAIAVEDYEQAAKLRDQIAELRRKESDNA